MSLGQVAVGKQDGVYEVADSIGPCASKLVERTDGKRMCAERVTLELKYLHGGHKSGFCY